MKKQTNKTYMVQTTREKTGLWVCILCELKGDGALSYWDHVDETSAESYPQLSTSDKYSNFIDLVNKNETDE